MRSAALPSRRGLLAFAWMLPFFFGVVGAFRWHAGSHGTAYALWIAGLALSLVAIASERGRRALYRGWMAAVFPIAWIVSRALLTVVFFVGVTPVALVLRVLGRDPLERRFEREVPSYWLKRTRNRDASRYFRQF